jgi:hypothetical protein
LSDPPVIAGRDRDSPADAEDRDLQKPRRGGLQRDRGRIGAWFERKRVHTADNQTLSYLQPG